MTENLNRRLNRDIVPGKSMVPLLSASTSLIMSCNSDSEGFWPSDLITVPSSLVVICPTFPIPCQPSPFGYHHMRDAIAELEGQRIRGLTVAIFILQVALNISPFPQQ